MRAAMLTTGLGLAWYVLSFYEFDFNNVFYRGFGEQVESTAMAYSVVNYFARPLLFNLAFLAILMRVRGRRIPEPDVWLAVAVIAVFVSPVGIPRSLAGALFIPLVVMAFVPSWHRKYTVLSMIALAILVAAPMVDVFRLIYARTEYSLWQNFRVDYFFSGHFDPFHNLAQALEYDFATDHRQVLGALLFWVPRSLWSSKPQGTSFVFAETAGLRSANVSFPLTAEFYVDFGIAGVTVGMLGLGLLYKYLDNRLSRPIDDPLSRRIVTLGHLELSILGIYLLRGSLMSTFGFTAGVGLSLLALGEINALVARLSGKRSRPTPLPQARLATP
jgi:oligosaccharide repeat unit polymerase